MSYLSRKLTHAKKHHFARSTIILGLTFGVANHAQAFEIINLRPFQVGALGSGLSFADIEKYETELQFSIGSTGGTTTTDADKITGSALKTRTSAAFGMGVNKNFDINIFADVNTRSYKEETRNDPSIKLQNGLSTYELGGTMAFRPQHFVFGTSLSLFVVGSEQRSPNFQGLGYSHKVSSAAMPLVRLFGGLDLKTFKLVASMRLFNKGDATVKAEDPSDNRYEYDISRRNPAEYAVDGLLKLTKEVDLGTSVAYVTTGQASEDINEYSLRYIAVDPTKRLRITGDERRNQNHLQVAAGSVYHASKMISVGGGLRYIQGSYNGEQNASLEAENVGGIRLDVGTHIRVQKMRGLVQVAYQVPNSVSYTAADDRYSKANFDKAQKAPIEKGAGVKTSMSAWEIAFGGGYYF